MAEAGLVGRVRLAQPVGVLGADAGLLGTGVPSLGVVGLEVLADARVP